MTDAPGPLAILGALLISSSAFYFVLSGLHYLLIFTALRRRLGITDVPPVRETLRAIRTSLGSNLGNAVLTAPIQWAIVSGHSRVYFRVDEYGVAWLIASVLLVLIVTETMIYWIHRGLHLPWLYARLHRQHHAFRRPTPWVSNAFHPLDSFAQALPYHLCAFLFPLHVGVYLGMFMFVMVWTVLIHDRTTLSRAWAINHTERHTIHHWYNKDNYGQFFTFWDRVCGTCRDVDTRPVTGQGQPRRSRR